MSWAAPVSRETAPFGLTVRQYQVYRFIQEYIKANSMPPTRKEIAKHFGFYQNAAHNHVQALAAKGAIKLLGTGHRAGSVSRGMVLA